MNLSLLALAVLPVIILSVVVYRQDRFEKEPVRLLIKAFFFGILAVFPVAIVERFLDLFNLGIPFFGALYEGYIVAGCTEELFKLLFLTWAVWKSREFDEYFDGIVYAAFVSLGFACFENIGYVFAQDTYQEAFVTGSVRALLSVPGHFLFGVTMGYHFALAKFDADHRASHLFKAFLYPMLLHGTFDSLLMIPESIGGLFSGLLLFVFILFDIKMWKWGVRRIRRLQALSQQQDADRSDPFAGFTWYV